MRIAHRLLAPLFAVVVFAACPPAGGPDGGVGDGGEDAGSDVLALGAVCTYGSTACGEGAACAAIFADEAGGPDTTNTACFATCAASGDDCTAAGDAAGACANINDVLICVATAGAREPCGVGPNAICAEGAGQCLRVSSVTDAVGFCATLCADDAACGGGDLRCSKSPLSAGDLGVCWPASTVGDACGFAADGDALQIGLCTDGQTCTGTACAGGTPPADAGTVVDAGNAPVDAGNAPDDAGNAPVDAGNAPDDAGFVDDAGTVDDAGSANDAGTTDDAGDVVDSGVDAGV